MEQISGVLLWNQATAAIQAAEVRRGPTEATEMKGRENKGHTMTRQTDRWQLESGKSAEVTKQSPWSISWPACQSITAAVLGALLLVTF